MTLDERMDDVTRVLTRPARQRRRIIELRIMTALAEKLPVYKSTWPDEMKAQWRESMKLFIEVLLRGDDDL